MSGQVTPGHENCIVNRGHVVESKDWTGFLSELAVVISELVIHERAFVVVEVPGPEGLFVQLQVPAGGSVHAEAVSTMHRPCATPGCVAPRHVIPNDWRLRLRQLGWRPFVVDWADGEPGPDHRVNFHRSSELDWIWVAAMFSELLVRTLVEVFGARSPADLNVKVGRIAGDGFATVAA